uniref:Uncharacterized protein n=1 Tax=Plectus sambesii TaxID=2011161 RepID=A0A914W6E9_9BILA
MAAILPLLLVLLLAVTTTSVVSEHSSESWSPALGRHYASVKFQQVAVRNARSVGGGGFNVCLCCKAFWCQRQQCPCPRHPL